MTAPGELTVHPIRRLSDDPLPPCPKAKARAQRLLEQGYSPNPDGMTVRKGAKRG